MKHIQDFEGFLNEFDSKKTVEIIKGPHKGKFGMLVHIIKSKETGRVLAQVKIGNDIISVPASVIHIEGTKNKKIK